MIELKIEDTVTATTTYKRRSFGVR